MSRPTEKAMTVAIGEVAMLFSNLEFAFSSILAKLLDPSPDAIAGALVCERFTLSQTIQHVRRIAGFRFCHDGATRKRLTELCSEVDSLRATRNLFIHGMWVFDPERLAKGEIVCLDMRWQTPKGAPKNKSTISKANCIANRVAKAPIVFVFLMFWLFR